MSSVTNKRNITINIAIADRAKAKIEMDIKKVKYFNLCLKARMCPVCGMELLVRIDDNRNMIYKCSGCTSFNWPPEQDKSETQDKPKIKFFGPRIPNAIRTVKNYLWKR